MKNNKTQISRRKFIEKSVLGTGIIISGSVFANVLEENSVLNAKTNLQDSSLKEGNFPFYKYVNDFHFGQFIPKDQGGKFIQMELLGTEDDGEITKIINNEFIFKHLGSPNDWSIFEKTELEKSVWFNRFYYLPSFARMYFLERKNEHLVFMMELLKNWIKENPVVGPSKSKYNWFDMQVAWRSINLSWCYYLTINGLSDSDKKVIYDLQAEHAKILMKDFGKKELNEFNHQSHGALAILYLAVLFPSLPEAETLLPVSIRIIEHHVKNAFFEDGGNVEQMFGYYPFMTSVFRDAFLLLRSNSVGIPEQILPLLSKMYSYLKIVAQPDGTVPPINDSYEETTKYVLLTLEDILGKENIPQTRKSVSLNSDSRFAVIRSDNDEEKSWYIGMNAARLIGSHAHAGRLAVNFWYNRKAIFVDSGCCNYDNPLLVDWYRTSEAHNTVIIDGKSDFATSQRSVQWVGKRITENIIRNFIVEPEFKFCRMVSPESDPTNSGVRWTRDTVLVLDKFMLIHDCFECNGEHEYETIFRYADVKVSPVRSSNRLLIDSGDKLIVIPISEDNSQNVRIKEDYFGSHAKNIKTPTSVFCASSNGTYHSSFLVIPVDSENVIEKISVNQKVKEKICKIVLTDESAQKYCFTINNGEVEEKDLFSLKVGG